MLSERLYGFALISAVSVAAFTQGCSSDNPLCCSKDDFEVGGTVTASIGGSATSQVAVQAVADIGGIAEGAVTDLTTACRNIAQDLNADQAGQDAAEAKADSGDKMQAWCELAINAIGTVKGSAKLTIDVTAPVCEASISAKASCQAKCSVDGKCDIKAHPPTCTGGPNAHLEVKCSGQCDATVEEPTIACSGSCQAECSGKCVASSPSVSVSCNGKCNGTCQGSTDAGGNCMGKCQGTCEIDAKNPIQCEGSCQGTCKGSCKADPGSATVQCSGKCSVDGFEPIKCTGGELKGGCTVDAKCDANCDASVQAKASCTPPQVKLKFEAEVQGGGNLLATLEANLPIIYSLKAKLEAATTLTGTISGNATGIVDIKAACIPVVASAALGSVSKLTASLQVSASVVTKVGS